MRKSSVCIITIALLLCAGAVMAAPTTSTSTAPAANSTQMGGAPAATTPAATTTTTTTTKATTKKVACKAVSGSVSAKDDTAKTITVKPKTGADVTFTTNDKTSYMMGKKKATWADVAADQTAHVTCTMDGTNMVAKTVKLAAPKAATTPK
jgi:hypothetical protein